jgi:hypothetical protein
MSESLDRAHDELVEWLESVERTNTTECAAKAHEIYSSHALDRVEVVRVLREFSSQRFAATDVDACETIAEIAHRLGLAGELGTREG